MQLCERLQQYDILEENLETFLIDEEFLSEDGEMRECFYCNSGRIDVEQMEYAKCENEWKEKIKKIDKTVKYHDILTICFCVSCHEILYIEKNQERKYGIWN